jgi:hypothetical protein
MQLSTLVSRVYILCEVERAAASVSQAGLQSLHKAHIDAALTAARVEPSQVNQMGFASSLVKRTGESPAQRE